MDNLQNKITLLRYKCIGCSYCISIAPELFGISDSDGKITDRANKNCDSDILKITFDLKNIDQIAQSARICPVKAIVF